MAKNKCATCMFAWRANGFEGGTICNYLEIFGHSRGCEPGNECTKYRKGKRLVQPPEARCSLPKWQRLNREKYENS